MVAIPCILFFAAAAYFVLVELHRAAPFVDFDIYLYFIPNKVHAVQSVWHGGKGLLWNPYQACGEPFFANPAIGLLYPPHLLFLLLDPNVAVHVVLILNMALGATGMLLLGQELGFGWAAALGAALIFQLGDPMSTLTGWSPMDNGPWTWVPWAVLCSERLLRAPSRRGVAALAIVLALSLLAGWVLISFLTYQLIALRLGWELVTRWSERPWRPAGAVVVGLALGACLAAVQLIPAAQLVSESQRIAVTQRDFLAYGRMTIDWRAAIGDRVPPVPFMVASLVLAAIAPLVGSRRRLIVFYLAAGVIYAVLALGPQTPLYDLYIRLPPGAATLRYPSRLFMITSFCVAVLAGFALDGIWQGGAGVRRLGAAVATVLTLALYWLTPRGLRPVEIVSLVFLVAALWVVTVRPRLVALTWVVVAAAVLNLIGVPFRYPGRLMASADALWQHANTFAAIRSSMTPQDRMDIEQSTKSIFDLSLVQKTASVVQMPDVYDYEPLLGHRLIDYVTTMWLGGPVNSVEETMQPTVKGGYRRRLFDVAAIRYVVTTPSSPFVAGGFALPPASMSGRDLLVYANDSALPRARWVPRVEVLPDANAMLNRLAYGSDDLATVAFVEEPLPSGFVGETPPSRAGTARFLQDDPEHLVLEVDAPARGFLVLADQYASGWQARVNGNPVPIVRANYTFRLVEVPAGTSQVEFRYRPASVAIGGVISLAAIILLGAMLRRKRLGPQTSVASVHQSISG